MIRAVLSQCDPAEVRGIDPSPGFVDRARESIRDQRAPFESGDAGSLRMESTAYDAVVSGLVLNFIPDVARGIAEMVRAVRPSGTVAAYVWDYAGKIEIMRQFWDVAVDLDPAAHFVDFDDYRVPFAGKQGSALTYLMSLGDEFRRLLKERLRTALPIATDGRST